MAVNGTFREGNPGRIAPPARLIGGGLTIESRWSVCVLSVCTFGMMSVIFAPIDGWWLAYVALVPWLVAVCTARRVVWMHLTSYLTGVAFWFLHIYWLYGVTPPGHIALSLYLGAYWPVTAYLLRYMVKNHRGSVALVLPFVWVAGEWLRSVLMTGFPWSFLAHSHHRVPTLIQISDLAGAYGLSFVIAAVNGWIVDMLIQPILVWRYLSVRQPRRVPVATVATVLMVLFTVIYGRVQMSRATLYPGPKAAVCQQDYPMTVSGMDDATPPEMLAAYVKLSIQVGPNEPDLIVWPESAAVATLNAEFLSRQTLADLLAEDPNELRRMRLSVGQWRGGEVPTVQAMQQLVPERPGRAAPLRTALGRWYFGQGMDRSSAEELAATDRHRRWRIGLFFDEWDYGHLVNDVLAALAQGHYRRMVEPLTLIDRIWRSRVTPGLQLWNQPDRPATWVVTGGYGYEFDPNPPPPRAKLSRFNSAYVYDPSGRQVQPRYDKVHCVLFGEYVPFRYGRLHGVYLWLNRLTPWGASGFEYSLTAGTDLTVYEMRARSQGNRPYRFAVPICYEDIAPEICRGFIQGPDGQKRVDFLLNISNDGWFNHSYELPQHLVGSVFRAVENRVGVARAVNTGISGFVDPLGRVYDCVTDGKRRFGPGVVGARVSTIWTDTRHSLYTRWGDWFAHACAVVSLLIVVDAAVIRPMLTRRRRVRGVSGGAKDR